jgi:hypothetical protein
MSEPLGCAGKCIVNRLSDFPDESFPSSLGFELPALVKKRASVTKTVFSPFSQAAPTVKKASLSQWFLADCRRALYRCSDRTYLVNRLRPIKLAYRSAKSLASPDLAHVESTTSQRARSPRDSSLVEPTATIDRRFLPKDETERPELETKIQSRLQREVEPVRRCIDRLPFALGSRSPPLVAFRHNSAGRIDLRITPQFGTRIS